MKKRRLISLLSLFMLFSCGGGSNESTGSSNNDYLSDGLISEEIKSSGEEQSSNEKLTKIELEKLQELLLGDVGKNEVLYSSKVEFEEHDKNGTDREIYSKEVMNIYSNYVSVANGSVDNIYYTNGNKNVVSDSYERVAQVKTYNEQSIFYLVTDYENGTLNYNLKDSAYRLPIYEDGDSTYDGISYLLLSSVPGQVTKQVSLIVHNFISQFLTNNADIQTAMPYAQISYENDNILKYYLEYSYKYSDDDGSEVKTEIGFSISIKENRLLEASTLYKTTTTRDDESYVEEDTTSYKISYDERKLSSSASFINVEDYFLEEVNEVKAYYYNDKGEKEYTSINNLPVNKYIRFEASTYAPLKAVDIEMYAKSSSNEDVISVTSDVFETKSSGEAKVQLESATGVLFAVDVRVAIPEIKKIKFDDSSSNIEKDGDSRYIYTSTTYDENIYVSVNPSSCLLSDVEISVSDEDVLEVVPTFYPKVIQLKLIVKDTDKTKVTISFKSKTNPDVKLDVEFNIKKRLSDDEMYEKLLNNTFKWTNIYSTSQYSILEFTSNEKGKVTYYDGNNELGSSTFTYSFNGTTFNIKMDSNYYGVYNYDSGEIKLDASEIVLRVNVTDYVHHYVIVED